VAWAARIAADCACVGGWDPLGDLPESGLGRLGSTRGSHLGQNSSRSPTSLEPATNSMDSRAAWLAARGWDPGLCGDGCDSSGQGLAVGGWSSSLRSPRAADSPFEAGLGRAGGGVSFLVYERVRTPPSGRPAFARRTSTWGVVCVMVRGVHRDGGSGWPARTGERACRVCGCGPRHDQQRLDAFIRATGRFGGRRSCAGWFSGLEMRGGPARITNLVLTQQKSDFNYFNLGR